MIINKEIEKMENKFEISGFFISMYKKMGEKMRKNWV